MNPLLEPALSGGQDALHSALPPAGVASRKEFLGAWLKLECESISGAIAGVLVLGTPSSGTYAPVAFWPPTTAGAQHLADIAERVLGERRPAIETLAIAGSCGLAFPIEMDGQLQGVVAVEVSERPIEELQQALQSLQWGGGWIEAQIRRERELESQGAEGRLVTVLDLVASVVEEERFEAACRSLVTELAQCLHCDRVSMGIVRRGSAAVVALSHSAQFGKRMNLIHAVGACMNEAIDQKAVVRFPAQEHDEIIVTRDHENLAREHGSGSILTVPFSGSGDFKGALTLERPAGMPFAQSDLDLSQSVSAAVTRILEAKKLSERTLAASAYEALKVQLRRMIGPRFVKRKLAAVLAVGLLVFFTFATGDYRVTAPATLEGAVRRSLAAPFDGYIASADIRAGEIARAGTVLATLDDQDLRIERLKWASQYAQYVKQHQEATANRERAKAQIAEALYEQARAQANLLDEQLSRAAIKAPFDGVIVKGDLSQSLGAAVKRGDVLFEITPLESYRVIVEVDETEIADVSQGKRGTLVLGSISDEVFPFFVKNVTPVTVAREGRNYFRVEGILDSTNDRLRPGMQGVGKVEVERRRIIWIWTHKLVNWARLFLWTYLP